VKFAFIHAEKAQFPVAALCRLLGVSRQGYYAFAGRGPTTRTEVDAELNAAVRAVFERSRGTYGSPRVRHQLRHEGIHTSKRRVERVMRGLGLVARRPRRFMATTLADASHRVEPNVLDRDFSATRPDERWVTDITYVWTDEGWAYVAAILDLFSRAVVGWAVDATLSTQLPLAALEMAVRRRRPGRGLLHHSDRGSQYTSDDYRAELAALGVTVSMSRKGNCWDNAVAESFFATLKAELVARRRWSTRSELRAATFEYIETFYNRRRLHSALSYKTPAEVERVHQLAAA
jgi:transposase InsO family protein